MRLFEGTPWDRPPRCECCGELDAACMCQPPPAVHKPPSQQTARVSVEKRKRGKVVTVVDGLLSADNDFPALLTLLKSTCGAGGTVKQDSLEIQGAHKERVISLLKQQGYQVVSR